MPRFFPSLHRSRDNTRDDYAHYDSHAHYDSRQSQPSAWRRVAPTRHADSGNWQEEFVEYPESYAGPDDYHPRRRPSQPSERDYIPRSARSYDVRSESTVTAEEEAFGSSRYYSRDNAIPIVQRESSLTRLQEVFSDHAPNNAPRPVTEVSLPQGTPRHSPMEMPRQAPPAPEIRNMVPPQQQPILVQNSTAESVEPEYIERSRSQRSREKRPASRHRTEMRSTEMRRTPSSPGGRSLDDEDSDYPPCVVVVERGRNGKQDTYYVIPGGAPVIFEDDQGNELTRVGDFSGGYRPRKQRPVIIEDEHGREVGRLGFDDETSLDYPYRNRSDESLPVYDRGRDHGYQPWPRDEYDKASSRTSRSNSSRYPPRDHEYHRSPDDTTSRGNYRPVPNVVYIPYTNKHSPKGSGSSHHSGRSSRHDYTPSKKSYQSSNVIHLDHYGREVSGSVSSGSSGRRSYGSSHRH